MENSTGVGESDGVSSLENSSDNEDCELPPPAASSSFSSMQAEHPFSSPKKVPAFKSYERLIPKPVWKRSDDTGTRVKWAVQALQNAGFNSITDFIETVYLERFAPGTTCHRIQKFEWEEGLPKMLGLIHNHSKKYLQWRHYDISPYRDAITDVALDEYKREFKVFAERKDERKWCPIAQMKVGPYTPPYLGMKAKDVRPDWLGTNVIKDSQSKFATDVCFQCLFVPVNMFSLANYTQTPRLWKLFTHLINPVKQDHYHISTLALNMLFKASNTNLRKVQTVIGVYLHTTGVPTQVITLLSQYGLSVGCKALERIMESLAGHQKERLRALGRTMTDKQLVIVYDNINIHQTKNQLRSDNRNQQFNGICGFVAQAIGGRTVPTRESLHPDKLTDVDPSFFSMQPDDEEYYAIVLAHILHSMV
jgi:hypothetical protein